MDWALWRRWTGIVAGGELAGFVFPAVAGAVLAGTVESPWITLPVIMAAGAVEGFFLGFAQALALRHRLPAIPRLRFAAATGGAAVAAYAIGMLMPVAAQRLGTPALIAVTTVGGLALLASIGTAQLLVLRRIGAGHPWWIATTAGAWAAGLAVFMVIATPLWQPGQPIWLTVTIGVGAGALMAITVAVLTGLAAVRLAPADHSIDG